MTGRAASQRSLIEPFGVMEVVAEAAALEASGHSVMHLEVGQPSSGAPSGALAVAIELLGSGAALGYTPACGIDVLRDRIARLSADRYGLDVDPRRVIVTTGASAAVVLAGLAAFDAGARIAVAEPGYPCYSQILRALGLEPVGIRVGADDGFVLRSHHLEAALAGGTLDGVMVASPANPTGAVYDAPTLRELTTWCAAHSVRLVADEIYHGITFGGPAPTATGAESIVIGSFSKYYCMTGWRLGWMVVPDELVVAVDRLSQNLYLSPPTLAQHVALAAMDCEPELDVHVRRYQTNREVLTAALTAMGVRSLAPAGGAFYLYGDVSHWGLDSRDLATRWLHEAGVAAAPGVDFDPVDGHHWMRWSLAGSTGDVTEAASRLTAWSADA